MLVEELDPQKNRWEIKRFMINRLPRAGTEDEIFDDANTSEVGGSFLNSSFWVTCGYNPSPAAGGGVSKRHIAGSMKWIQESQAYFEQSNSIFRTNLNKYEQLQEKIAAMFNSDIDRRKIEEEREELKERMEEWKKTIAKARMAIKIDRIRRRKDELSELSRSEKYGYVKQPKEEDQDIEESQIFNPVVARASAERKARAAVPPPAKAPEEEEKIEPELTKDSSPASWRLLVTPLRQIGHVSSSVAPTRDGSSSALRKAGAVREDGTDSEEQLSVSDRD